MLHAFCRRSLLNHHYCFEFRWILCVEVLVCREKFRVLFLRSRKVKSLSRKWLVCFTVCMCDGAMLPKHLIPWLSHRHFHRNNSVNIVIHQQERAKQKQHDVIWNVLNAIAIVGWDGDKNNRFFMTLIDNNRDEKTHLEINMCEFWKSHFFRTFIRAFHHSNSFELCVFFFWHWHMEHINKIALHICAFCASLFR